MTGDEATCARVTLVPEVALLFLPDTEYDLMLPVGAVLHPYSGTLLGHDGSLVFASNHHHIVSCHFIQVR